jgi:putative transposase
MKTVCDVIGVARSNIAARTKAPLAKPLGRPPQPEADLLAEIKAVIGEMPTYGYRRVWTVLRALPRQKAPTTSAASIAW